MKKHTIYGLPLNPMSALEQLRGSSFCVSYATREKLGKQLDQAIDLVGGDGILLIDNGAFSAWQAGVDTMNDPAYLDGFAAWANDILDRCDQAWVVLPDVIDGTHEDNWQLALEHLSVFDSERCMPVWHLHEPLSYLIHLCESFSYVAFGSSGDYQRPGTDKWHARIQEAFAAIDQWLIDSEGCYVRPRLHMMRAQAFAHLYPFDSSDSTNVAMNHNRQLKKSGEDIPAFAKRVDDRIQASAGPETEHQAKQPLLEHVDTKAWKLRHMAQGLGLLPIEPVANLDGLDIPDFLRRAA